MSYIPFASRIKINDGPELSIDANSLEIDWGLPSSTEVSLVNGSQVKTVSLPDFATTRSRVRFSIRINANEEIESNPIKYFLALKQNNPNNKIETIVEKGSGSGLFRNMTLKNDLSFNTSPDSSIIFEFVGDPGVLL